MSILEMLLPGVNTDEMMADLKSFLTAAKIVQEDLASLRIEVVELNSKLDRLLEAAPTTATHEEGVINE